MYSISSFYNSFVREFSVKKAILHFSDLVEDPDYFVSVLDLVGYSISVLDYKKTTRFNRAYDQFIYPYCALRAPLYYTEYFLESGKQNSIALYLANCFLFVADSASALLWLENVKIIDLSATSAKWGGVKVFSNLNPLISATVFFGYFCFGVNSFSMLANDSNERQAHLLDLASSVTTLALSALSIMVGYTYPPVLITLGVVATSTSLLAFIHRNHKKMIHHGPKYQS
jgi:hypothetical protein